MNAPFLGFFSGFPTRHFPDDIARRFRDELTARDRLVFISAWPSDAQRNDEDSAGMYGMFEERGMPFAQYAVIDSRTEPSAAKELIQGASCIFLMGGHAVQQFQLIREKGIADEIRRSSAAILGVSAGSINMAKRSVDLWESLTPYDGLGLADITVKAHFDWENRELLQALRQVSMELPVCAMEDESAIFIKDGRVTCTGQIHWIDKGIIRPFSPDILAERTAE
ncbi:MAG: Type 1 glutamine amidotransferase-like domain-containing protein [Christensenellaceae bacterium]|nr:Type 1 glutamine amidotransferase-like domain-containing protein [Christensenellaceae bacterium]